MFGIILALIAITIFILMKVKAKKKENKILEETSKPFPKNWKEILEDKVLYYKELSKEDKIIFEKRVSLFLATKKVKGIDTDVDDAIKLMVASSAIILAVLSIISRSQEAASPSGIGKIVL